MAKHVAQRLLLVVGLLTAQCAGFYLPGLAPVNFCEEDKITESCGCFV